MKNFTINSVGEIKTSNGFELHINSEFRKALTGLDEFKYIQVIYWFDRKDNKKDRSVLSEAKPYKTGPDELGVFATRTPFRPNPIATETVYVLNIDKAQGIITIPFIDAFDDTPIIDIKPYTPSIDKVENPFVPKWCEDWPKNVEGSGEFDWSTVFNFEEEQC